MDRSHAIGHIKGDDMKHRKYGVIRVGIAVITIAGLVTAGVLMALGSLGEVTRGLLLGNSKVGIAVESPIVLQTLDRSEMVIVLEGRIIRQASADSLLPKE
jgi:hypothetical protein